MRGAGFLVITVGMIAVIMVASIIVTQPNRPVAKQAPSLSLPTSLSFNLSIPTLTPSVAASVIVHIVAQNGYAKSVTLRSDSNIVSLGDSSLDVESGASADLKVSMSVSDVQDGSYSAKFWLHYSDAVGAHDSETKLTAFYVVPHVAIQSLGWALDWWQWSGKSKLSASDSTVARFKVSSDSHNVTYEGITAKASLAVSGVGLTIQPQSIAINPIGPQGISSDYTFTVNSKNTPPGQYTLLVELFSKDGQLITQSTAQFSVG